MYFQRTVKSTSALPLSKASTPSKPLLPRRILADRDWYFHRALGNQACGRLIQAKLKIGRPNDKYEQEADRVAEQVMRIPEPVAQPVSPIARKRCSLNAPPALKNGTASNKCRLLLVQQRVAGPN